MRELVILGSSIVTPPNSTTPHRHHCHQSPKPKTPSSLHTPSKPNPTVHSRSPLPSTPVRWNLTPPRHNSSLLDYYAYVASKLAEDGRLQDFLMVAESVIDSGVDPSHFVAALNTLNPVSKGISKNLREGNVQGVVDVLRKFEKLGVPPLNLFNGVAMRLLKHESLRILNSGLVEVFVELMVTLSGFCFSIKEMVEPSQVIKICVDTRNPKMAVRYACLLPHDSILFCTIMKEFGKKRDLDSALTAYEESKNSSSAPNMYVYRTIIDICGLCGDYMKSRYIYEDLLNQKVIPNIYVFNSLMNVNAHDLGYTFHVYQNIQNFGVIADVASYNILLKGCRLAGRVDLAQDIYREAKQLEQTGQLKLDVFTYCTIIKIFADAKLWQMALKIREDMLSSGVTPNTFTWSSLISACANTGLVEQAIQLFEEMLLSGCEPNSDCCNILLHACVEACQYDRAFRLFQSWKQSEVLGTLGGEHNGDENFIEPAHRRSINTVSNLASNSHHFNFIKKFPFTPTPATYNILLKACGSDYRRAKVLMDEMKTVGLSPNLISWSILMNICGGSGNVDGAVKILKNMRRAGIEPDVITYTTAIKVCIENKNLKLAFSLFSEMKRYQIKPNLVTYNTLLRARTRYGSLGEVQQCLAVYQEMRKAGYKSNDYYLKQLIEEWCEGVIQCKNQSRDEFVSYKITDLGRPDSLLLEKVAAHLQNSIAKSLAIDLQGLTKVEARIVVLAVLRMIKENHTLGYSINDDMWITLGVNKIDAHSIKHESEVKDGIFELLRNELGLEVLIAVPRYTVDMKTELKCPHPAPDLAERLERNRKMVSSTRRPLALQRLKVTRKSLHHWLQRKVDAVRS